MKKGCGFLFICAAGLAGITMLYNVITQDIDPLMQYLENEKEYIYTSAFVYENIEIPTDSGTQYIPIVEYTIDGSYYADTAYQLQSFVPLEFDESFEGGVYLAGDRLNIVVKAEDPDDYSTEMGEGPESLIASVVIWGILGIILVIIFMVGLRSTFRLKENPDDRFI